MTQDSIDKFNRKCAEFIGWNDLDVPDFLPRAEYNPHEDLNQLAEVVDKLFESKLFETEQTTKAFLVWANRIGLVTDGKMKLQQCLRDFVQEALT